ncbi:MAG: hypothetical protein U0Q16_15270 [Bryobacteraceae bacterium]
MEFRKRFKYDSAGNVLGKRDVARPATLPALTMLALGSPPPLVLTADPNSTCSYALSPARRPDQLESRTCNVRNQLTRITAPGVLGEDLQGLISAGVASGYGGLDDSDDR